MSWSMSFFILYVFGQKLQMKEKNILIQIITIDQYCHDRYNNDRFYQLSLVRKISAISVNDNFKSEIETHGIFCFP